MYGMYYVFKTSPKTTLNESMAQDQFVTHLISSKWDNRIK